MNFIKMYLVLTVTFSHPGERSASQILDIGYGGPCGKPKSQIFARISTLLNEARLSSHNTFISCLAPFGVCFPSIMYGGTPQTPPLQPGGPKKPFPKLSKTFILCPVTTRQPPWQLPGTTRDPLVTTWHYRIAWGTTWQPYKAKTLAKTTAFFSVKQPKFEFPALFSPEP